MRLPWVTAGTEGALALSSRRACFADCHPCRSAACHLSCLESTISSTLEGICTGAHLELKRSGVRHFSAALRRRGTFYGGPESFLSHFSDRGPAPEYGFGTTLFGSCGFYQQVCKPHGTVPL